MSTLVVRRPSRPVRPATLADFFPGALPAWSAPAGPRAELAVDGTDGVLTVEVPGLNPESDLNVALTGRRLTVSGTRRSVAGSTRPEARFSEARFARTVTVPEGTTADAISADYTAGILRVRVAGMYPAPEVPETVQVAITSDVRPAGTRSPQVARRRRRKRRRPKPGRAKAPSRTDREPPWRPRRPVPTGAGRRAAPGGGARGWPREPPPPATQVTGPLTLVPCSVSRTP